MNSAKIRETLEEARMYLAEAEINPENREGYMKIEAGRIDPRFYLGDSVRVYIGNHRIDLSEEKAKELYEALGVALCQHLKPASTTQNLFGGKPQQTAECMIVAGEHYPGGDTGVIEVRAPSWVFTDGLIRMGDIVSVVFNHTTLEETP